MCFWISLISVDVLFITLQLSNELEEKKNTIRHMEEKLSTLEQRLQDQSLSGDDQMSAITAEVRRVLSPWLLQWVKTLVYRYIVNRWDNGKKLLIARLDFVQVCGLSLNFCNNTYVNFRNLATVGRFVQVQFYIRPVDQSAGNITGLKCAKGSPTESMLKTHW